MDGSREVAVYTSTAQGRREFERLWRAAVETADLLSPLPFHTGMALMPLMGRSAVREALQARLASLDAQRARAAGPGRRRSKRPPRTCGPWPTSGWGMGQTEREWLVNLLGRVDRGEFGLRGEPAEWRAPADDPGWQMASDRTRYLELISRVTGDPRRRRR